MNGQAFCTSVQLTLAGLKREGFCRDREGGKRIEVEQSKGQKSHTEGGSGSGTEVGGGQQESQKGLNRTDRSRRPKAYQLIANDVMGGPQNSLPYQL